MDSSKPDTVSVRKNYGWYPWFVFGMGALFYCYEYYLRITPSVMTHELMAHFQINAESLGNLAAFYYYAYTPNQLVVGVLVDRYGPRRLLILAAICCTIGTFLFPQPQCLLLSQLGRFLVGFGSSFAFVGALKLATIWLPPNRFAIVSGLATSLGMFGAIFGDISLSSLVNQIGWQHTVYASGFAGIAIIILLYLFVRDAQDHHPSHTQQLSNMKQALVGLWSLVKDWHLWVNGFVGCCLFLSVTAFAELWGIPFLESSRHFTNSEAAIGNSLIFLGWAMGAPFSGWLSDHFKQRRLLLCLGSLFSCALLLVLLYIPDLPKQIVYVLLFLFGILPSVQIICFAIGCDLSPKKLSGTAIALTNMIIMLGGVFFQPLIGILLDMHWEGLVENNVHIYTASDYKFALASLPVCMLVSALVIWLVPKTEHNLSELK